MRLLGKRVFIPSALVCFGAILYFLVRLLLSSGYVTSAVIDSLSRKFNCNVKIQGASLGLRHLAIYGLTLSYRKSQNVYEVVKLDTMIVRFRPYPFFKTGAFDSIQVDGASVAIARDSEGWLTIGRIIEPQATLATKTFEIDVRRLRLNVGERNIPVESARIRVSSTWPKVSLELTEADILKGKGTGKAQFVLEEDPPLEAHIEVSRLDLAQATRTAIPGDLVLSGLVSCSLRFKGKASSPTLMEKGSSVAIEDLSARTRGRGPIFETARAAAVLQHPGGASRCAELEVSLGKSVLNATPWIHSRDSPDNLLAREKMESIFRGCPDFNATVTGSGLSLLYETIPLPFDAVAGEVQRWGAAIIFRRISAKLAGGSVEASWRHRGTDIASRYDGRVIAKDVEIREILENTPLKGRKIDGALSGEMRFATAASAAGGPEGEGKIEIANAKLWSLPILEEVNQIARLDDRTPGTNPALMAQFTLDKDMLHFTKIEYNDGSVNIAGKGDIYHSGEVDLRLRVTSGQYHQRNVPVLDDVVGIISDPFSTRQQTISVTGTFASPTASLISAPLTTQK